MFTISEVEFLALSILGCRCVRPTFLCDICTALMGLHSPFVAFFAGCVVLFSLFAFCLDEDCIPGWGECGRPLRLRSV